MRGLRLEKGEIRHERHKLSKQPGSSKANPRVRSAEVSGGGGGARRISIHVSGRRPGARKGGRRGAGNGRSGQPCRWWDGDQGGERRVIFRRPCRLPVIKTA